MRAGAARSSLDRAIEALHDVGSRLTQRGDHVQAQCPVHEDNRASLSVDYDAGDGKTMLYCHGSCPADEVREALGLTWPMLYDDYEEPDDFKARRQAEREEERAAAGRRRNAGDPAQGDGPGRGRGARGRTTESSSSANSDSSMSPAKSTERSAGKSAGKSAAGRRTVKVPALPKGRLPARLTEAVSTPVSEWAIVATYDYVDEQGEVIHQEVRWQRDVETSDGTGEAARRRVEKRFTQRWPDGRGGWLEKTPADFEPVLYRLPEIASWIAEGRRIWLCEGVKDADRVDALGEAATTNPSGAANFKASQAGVLAGGDVVLAVDHDLAGYRRAVRVASELAQHDVGQVRFALPRTTELHSDLSDHLDAGYPLEGPDGVAWVDLAHMERLVLVAEAEEAAERARTAAAEARGRAQLAQAAEDVVEGRVKTGRGRKPSRARVEEEKRFAARWAAETGKQAGRLARALAEVLEAEQRAQGQGAGDPASESTADLSADLEERVLRAAEAVVGAVREAHEHSDGMPEEISSLIGQITEMVAELEELEPRGRTTETRRAPVPTQEPGEPDDADELEALMREHGVVSTDDLIPGDPDEPYDEHDPYDPEDDGYDEDRDELDEVDHSKVLTHPTAARLPDPERRIPMFRGHWAYESGGEGRRRRGVYAADRQGPWEWVAPLPYVKARVIRRDGSGRRTGTGYLISAHPDDKGVLIGFDELRAATWANQLGLSLSQDDRIQKAASTAIVHLAEEAEEREAIPRVVDGQVSIPIADTLPGGYLVTSPATRAEAIATWQQILLEVARSPRMALVMGAATVGPFVAALRRQSHIVALYGDSDRGKSVTMATAGAIWGDTVTGEGNVVRPWNTSTIGVTRYLGQLGVLPPFLDEAGQASMQSPREWGKLIYDVCEGAQRMTAEMRGIGMRVSMPWHGVLISAGNGRMTDGLGAGKYAGVGKRVIDLETPLTLDAEHAERIKALLPAAFGHLGHEILREHSAATVEPLIDAAARSLGMPEGGNERTIARHLHAHLAGAMILDDLVDAGGELYRAAHQAAEEYLAEWAPPQHDADRILDAIRDALGSEPAMWPDLGDYLEHKRPRTWDPDGPGGARDVLPQHGINRSLSGITRPAENEGIWVAVFGHTWRGLCEDLGVDSAVACRELNARGVLRRTEGAKRAHEWTTKVKATGAKMYELRLADDDVLPDTTRSAGAPVQPAPQPGSGPDGDADGTAAAGPETGHKAGELPLIGEDGTPLATVTPDSVPGAPTAIATENETHAFSAEMAPLVPGQVPGGSGSVPGQVPGAAPALTCEVPGVPGQKTGNTYTGARARVETPQTDEAPVDEASGEEVIERLPERTECIQCGYPAGYLVNGVPLHVGYCAEGYAKRGEQEAFARRLQERRAARSAERAERAEAAEEAAAAPQGAPTAPADVERPAGAVDGPQRDARRGSHRGSGRGSERQAVEAGQVRQERFTAPAACLTAEAIHCADGTTQPWPVVEHLGDLAALAGRDALRLGWGGGEDRLPDPGQLWLFAEALERLGLPTSMPLPEKALTKAQRAKASEKMFAALDEHPVVAGAREAGWQFGQGDHLAVWTRMWHPELLPGGAILVGLPWHHIEGVPLFADQPDPSTLARRLRLFAVQTGVAYRLTTAATGLDLIDHHRPPRRDDYDDRGENRGRVALVRNTAAELPPWRLKTGDQRFANLEADYSWWRTWDSLPDSERGLRYVHGYDRGASYLVPWRGTELGVEGLRHRVVDDVEQARAGVLWDGKEKPGYYLVDTWAWESWALPDPANAAGAAVGKNRVWVTVHTLRQLASHGVRPAIWESWTWDVTARYLEGPGKTLVQARSALSALIASNNGDGGRDLEGTAQQTALQAEDAGTVLATIKLLYAATVGKLAERDHRPDFHLWRPDWRDHVIAASRTGILHTVTKALEISGVAPLAVDRDAIFYASDDPDPISAWPGDPSKLGTSPGAWKAIGTGDLQSWGPEHLAKRVGRWRYAEAVDALQTNRPAGAGGLSGGDVDAVGERGDGA